MCIKFSFKYQDKATEEESLQCEVMVVFWWFGFFFFGPGVLPLQACRRQCVFAPWCRQISFSDFCVDLGTGKLKGLSVCCCSSGSDRTLMGHLCFKLWVS